MNMFKKSQLVRLSIPLILLILLPIIYIAARTIQSFLTQASGTTASIIVDVSRESSPLNPFWNSYAQGGEESGDMIGPVVTELTRLNPNFIRVDHVFDHFGVVQRNAEGKLSFNYSELDKLLLSITKTGATPFISLSYMPQVIAENGDITGKPKDWKEWADVVKNLVEHVSGRNGLNLINVHYEVWNEPDLFGKWKYYGDKNYLTLYTTAVQGATRAQNINAYKIGGPATTALYKNWILALANHVSKNRIQMDFISWHRYSKDPKDFTKDAQNITQWLTYLPDTISLPRIISEWGFNSEIDPGYDTSLAAAHAVAVIKNTTYGFEHLFSFEVVDGLSPTSQASWGRWGMITHPQMGKQLKPRFHAFQLLNKLTGNELQLTGDGTWVTGVATRDDETVRILLTNYDPESKHTEEVPVSITGLEDGLYTLTQTRLAGVPQNQQIQVSQNAFSTSFILPVNSVLLLELTKINTSFDQILE